MTPIDVDEGAAALSAAVARERLAGTLAQIQTRFSPKSLARDAVRELRETGQELAREGADAARRHPVTIAGAVTGIILVLLRRPIGKLAQQTSDATASTVASLTRKRPRRRKNQPDTKGTSK